MAFDMNTPLGQAILSEAQSRGINNPYALSGALGGAMTESSFDPTAVGDNGSAYGGFQWRDDRQDALRQKAAKMGLDPSDPRVQAKHFWDEASGSEAGSGLLDANSPQDAASAIVRFLRPHGQDGANTFDNPQAADNWRAYADNSINAFRALNGGGGMMEGRSGSTGGLTPATDSDNSNVNAMLARYNGGNNNNAGGIPTGGLLGYFTGDGGTATLGDRLTKLGAAFAVRDKPGMAQEMLNSIRANQKASASDLKDLGDTGDGKYRKFYDPNTRRMIDLPNDHPDTEDTSKADALAERTKAADDRATNQAAPKFLVNQNNVDATSDRLDAINRIREGVASGKISLSGYEKAKGFTLNVLNKTDENAAEYKNAEAVLNQAVLQTVRDYEKGYTSNKQLAIAGSALAPNGAKFSNRTMLDVMDRIAAGTEESHRNSAASNAQYLSRLPGLADGSLTAADGTPMDADYYRNRYNTDFKRFDAFKKKYQPMHDTFVKNWDANLKPQSAPAAAQPSRGDFLKSFGTNTQGN